LNLLPRDVIFFFCFGKPSEAEEVITGASFSTNRSKKITIIHGRK
jgi:hypothetical protein